MKLTAKQLIARYNKKKEEKATLEQHIQEINDYVLVRKNNVTRMYTPGQKRNTHLLDNTAVMSCELLAGALHSFLTNPYTKWFALTTGEPDIDKDDTAREWLEDTERRMLNVLNDSNFQTEVHEFYLDLCGPSTACLLMEEDDEQIVRFSSKFIANYVIAENSKGIVDTVMCEWSWTAQKIAEEFGIKNLTKKVKEAYDKQQDTLFKIIHGVYPQDKFKKHPALKQFDFISHYVCVEDEADLNVEGFYEQPYIVSRWSKASDEEWGRGPGFAALPEAKIINKMTEIIIKAAQKSMDPPISVPDDGYILPLRTYPGGLNFRRAGVEDKIEPVFNKEIRVDFGMDIMEAHRQRIKQAFYVDQLMLPNNRTQKTATEINQRTEENLRLMGPMMGRQETEFLTPMINRLFKIMDRKGMFKDMPAIMERAKGLSVQYTSTIAKMQRFSEAQSIQRTMQDLATFIQIDPSIADNFDGDGITRIISQAHGFPQSGIRNLTKVKQIREARQKAQEELLQKQEQQNQVDQMGKMAPLVQGMQQTKK